MARPGEFELIERYFAPLATDPGAFRLADDAAVIAPPSGHEIAVTTDAVVAGIHFLADEGAASIARKALRVNLSDLAAMGATPMGYTVALALGDEFDEDWIAGFAAGLAEDQAAYDLSLLGGDTVRTTGPLTISITALGSVPAGRALRRNGARPGDLLYVSGTIGDAALGLALLIGRLSVVDDGARSVLTDRYRHPQPRTRLGPRLIGLATACLDVSDGLVGDLDHICRHSGCGARVDAGTVPKSSAASQVAGDTAALRLTGGDDYELLFAVPPEKSDAVDALGTEGAVPLSRIGVFEAGNAVRVVDETGNEIPLESRSWRHF